SMTLILLHTEALQRGLIGLEAKPGPRRRRDLAVLRQRNARIEPGVGLDIHELEQRRLRQYAGEMQGRPVAGAEIWRVRHRRLADARSMPHDLQEFGDAADLGDARLRVGHRLGETLELDRGAGVFAGRDWYSKAILQRFEDAKIL